MTFARLFVLATTMVCVGLMGIAHEAEAGFVGVSVAVGSHGGYAGGYGYGMGRPMGCGCRNMGYYNGGFGYRYYGGSMYAVRGAGCVRCGRFPRRRFRTPVRNFLFGPGNYRTPVRQFAFGRGHYRRVARRRAIFF